MITARSSSLLLAALALLGPLGLAYELPPSHPPLLEAKKWDVWQRDYNRTFPSDRIPLGFLGKNQNNETCNTTAIPAGKLCIQVPLPTPWSAEVDTALPLPEYPRPQMQREAWLNLNGVWDYATYEAFEAPEDPTNASLTQRILVPFAKEAPLSGVSPIYTGITRMAYRRTFTVPASWLAGSQRVLLNFGAVDWEAEVWVNGKRMGLHRGGYDKFSYDITDMLVSGDNTVAVRVWDPSELAHIPTGKQRQKPYSIWYTGASGIWQTVWLEPVAPAHIERLVLIPNIDTQTLAVTVFGNAEAEGKQVTATAYTADDKEVGTATGTVGSPFNVSVPEAHLWSVEDPYLYSLKISLGNSTSNETQGDTVSSYFGMRKVALGQVQGKGPLRVFVNNKFQFQMGLLDQGYWPDGIYTAPTDEALASDIQAAKALGFNMLRKHIKVESDRWYYHSDRLGILVWQDMPSMYWEDPINAGPSVRSVASRLQFNHELDRMLEEHLSHPCIITWTVFNEGWGQQEQTVEVVQHVQRVDPSRVINAVSGWVDHPVGHLRDTHNYEVPIRMEKPEPNRAVVLGEFGGVGLRVDNHTYNHRDAFAGNMKDTSAQLEAQYLDFTHQLQRLMEDPNLALSAAVYTELTDVENEVNGWLTYDRQVLKASPGTLPAANQALYDLAARIDAGDSASSPAPSPSGLAASAPNPFVSAYTVPGSSSAAGTAFAVAAFPAPASRYADFANPPTLPAPASRYAAVGPPN